MVIVDCVKMQLLSRAAVVASALLAGSANAASQAYTWKSVRIGGMYSLMLHYGHRRRTAVERRRETM